MLNRTLLAAAALLAMFVSACVGGPPDDAAAKKDDSPQFDADYYSKNAKEYFGEGRYGQAKDQWQKQLVKDPGDWMARLGIAYADLYLGEQVVALHNDYATGRKHVTESSKAFRELWGGTVEADTATADPTRPQWKAALGVALTERALGFLDQVESRGGQGEAGAKLQQSRDRHYEEAIRIFKQLAYMGGASPEAIKHLGELYVVMRQDAFAEHEFKRYLALAESTRSTLEAGRKEVSTQFGPDNAEVAQGFYDQKLASNADKQVSVLVDLAQIAWARQDYGEVRPLLERAIAVQPNRRDLYLKLGEVEYKLGMLESSLMNLNDFLRRASSERAGFNDDIRHAMKLRDEVEGKLKARNRSGE